MILRNRKYQRREPTKDATLIIIYCEGKKREPHYFKYFHELSSQIRLEIVEAKDKGNNSPSGLFEQALKDIVKSEDNINVKYIINETDYVWFVIDTDEWGDKINELKLNCDKYPNWKVAQSNPCFEVWLYYHKEKEKADFEGMDVSKNWKSFLNDTVFKEAGGFNSLRHPIFIKNAIEHSLKNLSHKNGDIGFCETEVGLLAQLFYPFVKEILEEELDSSKDNE